LKEVKTVANLNIALIRLLMDEKDEARILITMLKEDIESNSTSMTCKSMR
jgi:hypothetical protein